MNKLQCTPSLKVPQTTKKRGKMAEQKQDDQLEHTYICEDTGCSSEDLPEAMNDREKWRERVRDIRPSATTC